MQPLVSIIISVFNYESFIQQTLESVEAQTFTDWECIIINDGSTDNSCKIAEQFAKRDSRFRYFYQENQGLSSSRNKAIKLAQGKYLQFLDADDLISKQKIELQVNCMESNREIDLSYTDAVYFNNLNSGIYYKRLKTNQDDTLVLTNDEWIKKFDERGLEILPFLIVHNLAPVSSFLFKRTIIEKIGDFNIKLTSLEDWDFWLRCAEANLRFTYLGNIDAQTLIRVHESSMTQNRKRMALNYFLLMGKRKKYIQANPTLKAHNKSMLKHLIQRDVTDKSYFCSLNHSFGILYTIKMYLSILNGLRKKKQ